MVTGKPDIPACFKCAPCECKLSVLKNGSIIDRIDLMTSKGIVIGRAEDCGCSLAHLSISRYHAMIGWQQDPEDLNSEGLYLYDFGSTHGTILNKAKVLGYKHIKLQDGYVIKFGASSRLFVVECSQLASSKLDEDSHQSTVTHQQMRKVYERMKQISKKVKYAKLQSEKVVSDESDNSDQDDMCLDDVDMTEKDEFYLDNPLVVLRSYFEREGCEMVVDYESVEKGVIKCVIELPVYRDGLPVVIEVQEHASKKEVTRMCALEACRELDKIDVLREEKRERQAQRRIAKLAENDFLSSDEDTFYDRTGELESKRLRRMKRYASHLKDACTTRDAEETVTFESLKRKLKELVKQEQEIRSKLEASKMAVESTDTDDVDKYIEGLLKGSLDKKEISKLKTDLVGLLQEKTRAKRLIKIAASSTDELKSWETEFSAIEHPAEARPTVARSDIEDSPGHTKVSLDVFDRRRSKSTEDEASDTRVNSTLLSGSNRCLSVKADGSSDFEEKTIDNGVHEREEKKLIPSAGQRSRPGLPSSPKLDQTVGSHKIPNTEVVESKSEHAAAKRRKVLDRVDCPKTTTTIDRWTSRSKTKNNEEDKFVEWQPPVDQCGDGRTALNDKFGY